MQKKHTKIRPRAHTYVNANIAADLEATTRTFEENKTRINGTPGEALRDIDKSYSVFWNFPSSSSLSRITAALAATLGALQRGKDSFSERYLDARRESGSGEVGAVS
jgi:hypothetical protein